MAGNIAMPAQKRILQRIKSNYGWSLLSDVGGKGFLFLVTVYLARNLGVKQFGLITYAQTLAVYFWLGVDLGINMYGSREISRDKQNAAEVINPLLTLRIVCGLVVFAVFIAAASVIGEDPVQRMVYMGSAFYLLTRAINIEWVMRGFERFEYMAVGNVLTFASMMLLVVVMVKDGSDVVAAAYIWSFSYLIGGALMLWALRARLGIKWRPSFGMAEWKRHLRESLHFTASAMLINLYAYLPILFLGLFSTRYDVGIFSAPFKVVTSMVFLVEILPLSLYPIFSELHTTDREKFRRLFYRFLAVSAVMGLAIGVTGAVFGRQIMMLIFGERYTDSVRVLVVIIWFAAMVPLRMSFRTVIAASGFQRFYTLVAAFGVVGFTTFFFGLWKLAGMPLLNATCAALVATEVGVLGLAAAVWHFRGARSLYA